MRPALILPLLAFAPLAYAQQAAPNPHPIPVRTPPVYATDLPPPPPPAPKEAGPAEARPTPKLD